MERIVQFELQLRRVAHLDRHADFMLEEPGRAFENPERFFLFLFIPHHTYEHHGGFEVRGDLHVHDSHETQARILDPFQDKTAELHLKE